MENIKKQVQNQKQVQERIQNQIQKRKNKNNQERAEGCSFGEYIKSLRLNKKLTLRDVEKLSGISNSYLSQIEQGKRSIPTMKILFKLAKVYMVSSYKIVEQAEKEFKKYE